MLRIFCRAFSAVVFALALPSLQAADTPPRALPLATPASLDSVTFTFRDGGVDGKVTVTSSPTLLRVDEPLDRWSFIYNPTTQIYTGLEHDNYTYWSFSWTEVRNVVEGSKRGSKRLQDMSLNGLNADIPDPSTNAPPTAVTPDTTSLATGDDTGYVWKQAGGKKRIAGLDCERWTGSSLSGEDCEVWCYNGPLFRVTAAIAHLRETDEPITLVPIRTVAPDFIFPVCDALAKSGLTPVQITWGHGATAGMFRLVEQKSLPYDARLFTVPKLYVKTTLITLDGMIPEQPMPGSRSHPAPRVNHLTPDSRQATPDAPTTPTDTTPPNP